VARRFIVAPHPQARPQRVRLTPLELALARTGLLVVLVVVLIEIVLPAVLIMAGAPYR